MEYKRQENCVTLVVQNSLQSDVRPSSDNSLLTRMTANQSVFMAKYEHDSITCYPRKLKVDAVWLFWSFACGPFLKKGETVFILFNEKAVLSFIARVLEPSR